MMELLLRCVGPLTVAERRAALDRWTEELFGQRVCRRASGAPYLYGGVPISVSHTGEWLALAFDRDRNGPCGVDIELSDRSVERVTARFVAPEEWPYAPFEPNCGLWIWCAKEALYKVAGREGVDWLRDIRITALDRGTVCGEVFRIGWRTEGDLLVVWAEPIAPTAL